MARIAGVNLSNHKHIVIALRSIFGIGATLAKKICETTKIDPTTKVSSLSEDQLNILRTEVKNYNIEGNLRRKISMDIKRLTDLGSYRGIRHRRRLPVRGQRTKTNARTRKGPRRLFK